MYRTRSQCIFYSLVYQFLADALVFNEDFNEQTKTLLEGLLKSVEGNMILGYDVLSHVALIMHTYLSLVLHAMNVKLMKQKQ